MKKNILVSILLLMCCLGLAGCSSKSAYNDFKANQQAQYNSLFNQKDKYEGKSRKEIIYIKGMEVLNWVKPVSFCLGGISFIVGFIIWKKAKRLPKLRRFGFSTLMLGIPILFLIVVVVMAGGLSILEK